MSHRIGCRLFTDIWSFATASTERLGPRKPTCSWISFKSARPINELNCDRGAHSLPSFPSTRRRITRQFASGGILLAGTTPLPKIYSTAVGSAAACAVLDTSTSLDHVCHTSLVKRFILSTQKRSLYTRKADDDKSRSLGDDSFRHIANAPKNETIRNNQISTFDDQTAKRTAYFSSKPNIIGHFPHAPTREELLAAATGFWSRLKVRFKWFSIRSVRPFNLDEITALFSWVILGHVLWIVLGTTTFFSIIIWAINTVFAQETLARWVGNYLTQSSGVRIVFESAIVPKWRDGVITFKDVFVSRRPGQGSGNVSKGSSKTAAALAAALRECPADAEVSTEEDGNYMQFDVSVDTVNVTLSFTKWFNGRGLLKDMSVKGIRGLVDRTHVVWPEGELDPLSFRAEHNPGDFELDSFKMEDVLVTVFQPDGFRPFPVSVYSADLPRLRRQWLFYDFASANTVSGSYDNSLFTIHPRQTHRHTGAALSNGIEIGEKPSMWKKHNRIRIDGLNIDHLNAGVEGPFGWIREGSVDMIADVMFPADDDQSLAKVMSDFYDRLEATVTTNRCQPTRRNWMIAGKDEPELADLAAVPSAEEDKRVVVTDFRLSLNNVRAAVPLFTPELSYRSSALIRPMVAYINSRPTFIPIQCRIVKRMSDFDGSWTMWDSGLMDDLSAETYDAFARDMADEQARKRRLRKVGLWSLQLAAQAILMGMASNFA